MHLVARGGLWCRRWCRWRRTGVGSGWFGRATIHRVVSKAYESVDRPLRRSANWAGTKGARRMTVVDRGATGRIETFVLTFIDRKIFEVTHISTNPVKTPTWAACPPVTAHTASFCRRNPDEENEDGKHVQKRRNHSHVRTPDRATSIF